MATPVEIDFLLFWKRLNVNERVETLVRDVLTGQSELKTLTNAYKSVIQSHYKTIIRNYTNGNSEEEQNRGLAVDELNILFDKIQNATDVVAANDDFNEFAELFEELQLNDNQEEKLQQQLSVIKKQNERFLKKSQERLDEYCQRMMIMAELHREQKRNFNDNLEKETIKIRDELMNNVVGEFQKIRVNKLRAFADHIENAHLTYYNAQLDTYKLVTEKHKVLNSHVFKLDNQLRGLKFEKRKIPYDHAREVEELTKTVATYNSTIDSLDEKLKEAKVKRVGSVEVSRRELKKMNMELSKLMSETARIHAKLCKKVEQSRRKKIKIPEEILKESCSNFINCTCLQVLTE